jgi:hypothetical protein
MESIDVTQIRPLLQELGDEALKYFDDVADSLPPGPVKPAFSWPDDDEPTLWASSSEKLQGRANELVRRLLPGCAALAEATKRSSLTGPEDLHAVKIATKGLRAALLLRRYTYHALDVIHDEGNVLGIRPPEQFERPVKSIGEAKEDFIDRMNVLVPIVRLVEYGNSTATQPIEGLGGTSKYRSGTAFIMMWMDPQHPELSDVCDAVKGVFNQFSIRAVRADDIEHEGMISEKVLNEIRSAEFLFADLTGSRPNVYYEVGYAHALGKRVILFRKAGTDLHFDLSGYNCPPYANLRDLKEKLTKRLEGMTNRIAAAPDKL